MCRTCMILILRNKIYGNIVAININVGEWQIALDYAFKELHEAKQTQKALWIAFAYYSVAHAYFKLGQLDSASHYSWKFYPFIGQIPEEKIRANILNNFCAFNSNLAKDSLLSYMEKCFQLDSNAVSCGNLATAYAENGKKEEAEYLWKRAFSTTSNLTEKVKVMRAYIRQKKKDGEHEEASKMSVLLMQLQDSLASQQENLRLGKIQTELEQQAKLNEEREYRKSLYGWITFCVVLLVASTIYIRYRIRKSQIVHQADQMQIEKSQETIAALEAEGAQHQKLLAEQQKVLLQHQEDHSQSLERGRLLYEQIRSGCNISLWKKDDFQDYLNYYWSVDAAFSSQLKSDYKNLTPRQQFFLILEHEGFSDEEIMRIFSFCNSSMRSNRCRIRQQKKQAK